MCKTFNEVKSFVRFTGDIYMYINKSAFILCESHKQSHIVIALYLFLKKKYVCAHVREWKSKGILYRDLDDFPSFYVIKFNFNSHFTAQLQVQSNHLIEEEN